MMMIPDVSRGAGPAAPTSPASVPALGRLPGWLRGLVPTTASGRLTAIFGAWVFLFSLAVYGYCVTPTVPFWDAGEFIACSYILGIPHPPGTPLYVLIGRLASLVPVGAIAVRVNLLSSVCSALAVLFTYLVTVRLVGRMGVRPWWLGPVGGVVAGMFLAWSPTFWDNAIEAEVYGASQAIMGLCLWLALVWWEKQGEARNDRLLWVILYVLFLSIGIHLGTFIVFPCIYLLVTMVHWGRVKQGHFWWSVAVFAAVVLIRFQVISAINDQDPRITELSMAPAGAQKWNTVLLGLLAVAVVWNLWSVLGTRFTAGIVLLAVLGISVHLFMYFRAHLHPAINEADPGNWEALKLSLLRDQYKPPEPIFRKAPLAYQFNYMYLRYFRMQWELFQAGTFPTWVLPVGLGVFGGLMNALRERKSFFLVLTLFLITGPFLVWYLNFRVGEVRERDYFFAANFQVFVIWIGAGAVALVEWLGDLLRRAEKEGGGLRLHPVGWLLAGVMLFGSVLPLLAGEGNRNFFRHNRRGNYIAHDYAYNMLVGLEPDAILFTNGDNDTFPLWYIQEVEKFRKDVRVICLSLLQTTWHIKQIRDFPPRVPITLNDAQIEALEPYQDRQGKIWMVNDIMVHHILKANDWKRPIYFAVTVPDRRGLEERMKMEGLVLRVYKDEVAYDTDVAKLQDNLNRRYQYRGFLTPAGDWDASVYKDDEASKLLQNYAAARVRLAVSLKENGRPAEALAELARIRRLSGHFPGVEAALGMTYEQLGMGAEAMQYYREVLKTKPDNAEVLGAMGHLMAVQGDTAGALQNLRRSIQLDPRNNFAPYAELVNIHRMLGEYEEMVRLLQTWLQYNPDDTRIRNYLNSMLAPAPPATPGGAR